MVRRFEYTPTLGWSISRYDTFNLCKRQYYYQYYPREDREFNFLKISTLKSLTSVPLEIGNVSHEVIKVLLRRLQKTAKEIDRERFMEFVRRETLRICGEKDFIEVYYKDVDEIDPETQILPKVLAALNNLLDSPRLPWLMKEALETKDEWLVEPEGYGECRIDGMKAYCKVDFLFPVGDEIHIYDWKTGKKDEKKHPKQMRGYVTWAHFHYGVDYTKIKPKVAYLLPEYEEQSVPLNEFDIQAFSDLIREETDEMYGYLENVETNKPKLKSEFKMTDNLRICSFCNFRELCGRD